MKTSPRFLGIVAISTAVLATHGNSATVLTSGDPVVVNTAYNWSGGPFAPGVYIGNTWATYYEETSTSVGGYFYFLAPLDLDGQINQSSLTFINHSWRYFDSMPFNGLIFTFPNMAARDQQFSSASVTDTSGQIDSSRVSFNDHQIAINYSGLYGNPNGVITVNFQLVPEAAPFGMVALGGVMLLVRRRRLSP